MEIINCTIQFLNEYFRPILLTLASGFSIYFAAQKIGHKVVARYEISRGLFSAEHISKVVLSNRKDKPISIWSIHALIDNDAQLELGKFDPPLILKANETISVSLAKYSDLYLNNENITNEFLLGNLSLHVDIGYKLLECKNEKKKDSLNRYHKISKRSTIFNGHIFNKDVLYILVYYYENKQFTAFVDRSGFIGNEWGFAFNHIGKRDSQPEDILKFLEDSGLSGLFSNYVCFKVDYPKTEFLFKKPVDA